VPFILVLVYVGAFAEKNVFEDLGVVLAFGALGWLMAKLDWPRPPLLLGLVLGPLAENRLFLSTDNYGAAWLLRPGVLVIAAVIAIGLVVPIVRYWRTRPAPGSALGTTATEPGGRLDGGVLFSLGLVILFATALWMSRRFDLRAGLFPWAICTASLILAVVSFTSELAGRRRGAAAVAEGPLRESPRRILTVCGWIVGMYAAIWLVGFALAALLTTLLYLRAARERWSLSLVLSLAGFVFVYGLFQLGLGVPFPPGRLLDWLGHGG
jgi:Tripartite tricarboxylate transporter TctB family/Tripartite tricarboxylate transporter TctA family